MAVKFVNGINVTALEAYDKMVAEHNKRNRIRSMLRKKGL